MPFITKPVSELPEPRKFGGDMKRYTDAEVKQVLATLVTGEAVSDGTHHANKSEARNAGGTLRNRINKLAPSLIVRVQAERSGGTEDAPTYYWWLRPDGTRPTPATTPAEPAPEAEPSRKK